MAGGTEPHPIGAAGGTALGGRHEAAARAARRRRLLIFNVGASRTGLDIGGGGPPHIRRDRPEFRRPRQSDSISPAQV